MKATTRCQAFSPARASRRRARQRAGACRRTDAPRPPEISTRTPRARQRSAGAVWIGGTCQSRACRSRGRSSSRDCSHRGSLARLDRSTRGGAAYRHPDPENRLLLQRRLHLRRPSQLLRRFPIVLACDNSGKTDFYGVRTSRPPRWIKQRCIDSRHERTSCSPCQSMPAGPAESCYGRSSSETVTQLNPRSRRPRRICGSAAAASFR